MNNKIEITEYDLYAYINFPDELTVEKREYIKNNEAGFPELQFFSGLNDDNDVSFSDLIERHSNQDSHPAIIPLFRVGYEISYPQQVVTTIAAKSAVSQEKLTVITLTDKENKYLLKLIPEEDAYRVFLFRDDGQSVEKAAITFTSDTGPFTVSPGASIPASRINEQVVQYKTLLQI